MALLALGAALAPATTAEAAVEPGTPVVVAPGVPGHGRAWELITPPDPVSAFLVQAKALSPAGNRLAYTTAGPLPGAPAGAPLPTTNLAVRGAGGWENRSLPAPNPLLGGPGFLYPGPQALSPDLESSLWISFLPLRPGASEKETGLFRRSASGTYELLAEVGKSGALIGATTDLQHSFFTSEAHLLPADATRTSGASIYEVAGGELRLVDAGADGKVLSSCGASVLADEYGSIHGTISADGQRLFFSAKPDCAGPTRVYLREAGTTTTEIAASRCQLADCGPEFDAYFAGATPSGKSAFLVTAERLVDEDSNSHADLYRYEVDSGALTLLSSRPGEVEVEPKQAPVAIAANGTRAYALVDVRSGPQAGQERLFWADAGGSGAIASGPLTVADSLAGVSADGRYALLHSSAPLDPADVDEYPDLYRYDAATDTVAAVSGVGNGPFRIEAIPEAVAETASSHPYRLMSADGSRVFFTTGEQLLPADRNDAPDVYEWANGDLGLISSATGENPAIYVASTPDGATVVFRTTATLLPLDRDGGDMDFYAARIGGGFPQAAVSEACGAAACPAAPRSRAGRAAPLSAQEGRRIELRRPSAVERRRFAASGWIELAAEVPRAGRLSAVAKARIGRRPETVAAREAEIREAGTLHLRLRLSRRARRTLARGEELRVALSLRLSSLPASRKLVFELGGSDEN